ncbi:MAG: hypothetical protein EA399_02020 [Desulfovibrionales bacterium]|nr:MAG: hypothetical protein EA399_02020 [Desulfovibrionales bacterium]
MFFRPQHITKVVSQSKLALFLFLRYLVSEVFGLAPSSALIIDPVLFHDPVRCRHEKQLSRGLMFSLTDMEHDFCLDPYEMITLNK